ncbi:hypothetical protein LTR67_006927 [Exophiala xenobiotica]
MPPTTQTMGARHLPELNDAKFNHFLDLPLEIRIEIYSYIAACPETRHNLMAVSQQISEECTPLIFRQLQFTIHAPYSSALQAGFFHNAIQFAPRCTPNDFDRFYLRKMSGFRLRNIHSLAYNVTRRTEGGRQWSKADRSEMEELGRVLLSHSGSLECLEEVVIYLKPGWDYHLKPGMGWVLIEVKIDKEKLWSHVSQEGRWDKIEQQLVRKGGPLQSWKISRRIDLVDVHVGPVYPCHRLKYISSTFRKTNDNDNQTPGESESLPVPTLMVQTITEKKRSRVRPRKGGGAQHFLPTDRVR